MAQLIVSSVVDKLADLLIEESNLPVIFSKFAQELNQIYLQIDEANIKLVIIKQFLKEVDSRRNVGQRISLTQPEIRKMRDLTYFIEDTIDTFRAEISRKKNLHLWFLSFLVQIKARGEFAYIKRFTKETGEAFQGYVLPDLAGDRLVQRQPAYLDCYNDALVGFVDNERTVIKQFILCRTKNRWFISIAGPAGIGKTSLAQLVYDNIEVRKHFDFQFWYYASEEVGLFDLLQKLVQKLMDLNIEVSQNNLEYLVTKTNENLRDKRYLVVLDNLWDDHSFEMFKVIFPDSENGSRVLITTCFVSIPGAVPYELDPLPQDKSCELLLKRAFRRRDFRATDCPNDLDGITKQFVKKCAGLPLALVVVGELLSTLPQTYDSWCKVLRSFQWHSDGKWCMDVIATCYERLPSFLQPCFLYLASFPEEYEISARSIIKIWIAEGFIPQERRGIPEDIAESYIEHLVLRSMVRVTRRYADSAIKYFCVHPVLREMAIHEAKETSFLSINPTENANGDTSKPRRAAFHGEVDNTAMDGFPRLRAILAFQLHNLTSMKFEFLRVIELCGSANLHYLPKQLKYMILLRYLGLRNTGIVKLPNSIGSLLNLQTLDARNTEIKHMPKSLWKINSLRHVQVLPHRVEGPPPSAHLENLQTVGVITTPKAWAKGSPCLPNLRKFQIDHPENLDWSIIVGLVRKLDHLVSLKISSSSNIPNEIVNTATYECHARIQHLHLVGVWSSNVSQQPFQVPPNLTKLVLDSSRIEVDPMPTLEKLRSLRILRLVRDAIIVQEIVCSAGGFPKLQHLEINNLANFGKWTVEENAMPMLKKLCVKKCPRIEMLPELQHVTTLSWDGNRD